MEERKAERKKRRKRGRRREEGRKEGKKGKSKTGKQGGREGERLVTGREENTTKVLDNTQILCSKHQMRLNLEG